MGFDQIRDAQNEQIRKYEHSMQVQKNREARVSLCFAKFLEAMRFLDSTLREQRIDFKKRGLGLTLTSMDLSVSKFTETRIGENMIQFTDVKHAHLSWWQRFRSETDGLVATSRGPKPIMPNYFVPVIVRLDREFTLLRIDESTSESVIFDALKGAVEGRQFYRDFTGVFYASYERRVLQRALGQPLYGHDPWLSYDEVEVNANTLAV